MTRASVLALVPLLLSVGCQKVTGEDGYASTDSDFSLFPGATGAGAMAGDSDGDGLSDADEAALGSDPNVADTDGDGYDDGLEADSFTDPTDDQDHPYQGGWPIASCRSDISGNGHSVGDIAQQFTLEDQFGDILKLHDFCDKVVLLVSSATWCGPCNTEAPDVGAMYDQFADDGLMVITLLTENAGGSTPSQEDLESWESSHGLNHPVVADVDWDVTGAFVGSESIGIPTMHLLSPGAIVELTDGHVDSGLLQDALSNMN
jgi:peroxiredoxin